MEELNFEIMDAALKEAEKVLKENNADFGMLSLTLHKSIHDNFSPKEWVDYLKKHNYKILIKFVDNNKTYKLELDGTLREMLL